ncbi:MAG: hypothetical protein ABEH40_01475 [Haloferacaceae archaeon]
MRAPPSGRPPGRSARRTGGAGVPEVVERDGSTAIRYRVTNKGNAPLTDVAVSGSAGDVRLPGAAIDTVPAASAETVTIPIGSVPDGEADIEASYAIDDRTGSVERTVALTGAPAAESDDADAAQSISAPAEGSGSGGLPLSGIAVALVGLLGTAAVGYRRRGR